MHTLTRVRLTTSRFSSIRYNQQIHSHSAFAKMEKATAIPNTKTGSNKAQKNQKHGGQRGRERDSPQVRMSKTLSWILRHGARGEGLAMRSDGYVKVTDLLKNPRLQSLDLESLQKIVESDSKGRYDLHFEPDPSASDPSIGAWWIGATQGHSIKSVKLDLQPITSVADIPTGMAVHGTNVQAWQSISQEGLSKMNRNHIHLAQGENAISGMRQTSQVLIFIDVQKALDAGIKFFLSTNGVVLTEGDHQGYLGTQFFKRVVNAKRVPLPGWEGEIETANNEVSST